MEVETETGIEFHGLLRSKGLKTLLAPPCSTGMSKKKLDFLSPRAIDRIIGMAWEDHTPFDAIETQFGVSEDEVIQLMRREMHPKNFRKWRARVQGRKSKHSRLRSDRINRFKSRQQRIISNNRKPK